MPFEVSTTRGIEMALNGAELRNADLEIGQQLQQERLEFLVGAIDLVDQQHRRLFAPDRGEQRSLQQIALGEDVLLDRVGVLAHPFARLDGEQLALIVPFVQRGVLVEALVALQADELRAVHGGERLRDLGLADARLALEQQRALAETPSATARSRCRGRRCSRRRRGGRRCVRGSWVIPRHLSAGGAGMPGPPERIDRIPHACSPSFSAASQVRQ